MTKYFKSKCNQTRRNIWGHWGFVPTYSSNKIRKTQNEHLIIVCQNLIGLQFKINFSFLLQKLCELVKPLVKSSCDWQYLRKGHFNFDGKFELRSQSSYYNCTDKKSKIELIIVVVPAQQFPEPFWLPKYIYLTKRNKIFKKKYFQCIASSWQLSGED